MQQSQSQIPMGSSAPGGMGGAPGHISYPPLGAQAAFAGAMPMGQQGMYGGMPQQMNALGGQMPPMANIQAGPDMFDNVARSVP